MVEDFGKKEKKKKRKEKNRGFCFRFTVKDIVYNETKDHLIIDNEIRGFSFSNIVDSVFTVMANGLDSIVTSIIGTEKSGKPKPNRVNYKNYQLIRLFPSTQGHVNELKELKEAETEDIKFWSEPMYNKCVSCIFPSSFHFFNLNSMELFHFYYELFL